MRTLSLHDLHLHFNFKFEFNQCFPTDLTDIVDAEVL